jgi:hypothetical protein
MSYVRQQTWIENGPPPGGVMRVRIPRVFKVRGRGLGATQLVPASQGVTPAVAQAACTAAGGTWSGGTLTQSDGTAAGGCNLDIGATLPNYCNWLPFASALSSECVLPSTPAQLTSYGNYTAFKVGMQSGVEAEQALIAQDNQQSSTLLQDPTGTGDPEANCEYMAAANYPIWSQIFGPTLVCAGTDPANSSYSFLLYGGLALAAALLFMGGKH